MVDSIVINGFVGLYLKVCLGVLLLWFGFRIVS